MHTISRALGPKLAGSFFGFKCTCFIPVQNERHRNALIWATLNARFDAIRAESVTRTTPRPVRHEVTLLGTAGREQVLDIVPDAGACRDDRRLTDERTWQMFGWEPLTLTHSKIDTSVEFVTAVAIWEGGRCGVDASASVQVGTLFADVATLRLGELLSAIRSDRDPVRTVFALACSGHLEIELGRPIGPESVVRSCM